ncbi:MAG: response regulator transcription factor, partial [Myxococcales bacterium]|nr:response regulator transcription factor [Myxococcales bacterium]
MATRLLLIDTDADFTRELRSALQALGFEVEVTTDPEAAIQIAKLDPPTAVVIGLMDARGTGYAICSKLRRRLITLPVMMVIDGDEAGSDRLARHQLLKTRAQAYLARPFTVARFHDTLSAMLPKPLPPRIEDLSQVVGELHLVPGDSLLGESLFAADELDAISAEADLAFDNLFAADAPPPPTGELPSLSAETDFALTDEDLMEIPDEAADSLAGDPDLLALDRDMANAFDVDEAPPRAATPAPKAAPRSAPL